jgi:hypothetical protein
MKRRLGLLVAVLGLATACSGDGAAKKPPAARGSTDATPDAGGESVVVTMESFPVPPGGEAYRCQNFANPFGGANVDIDRFEAHMPHGAHHMIVFFMDDPTMPPLADGELEECSGSEFHPNVFGAQTPDGVIDLPEGVGVAIPSTTGLRMQIHFVNGSDHEVTAGVTTSFHVAMPGSIVNHAGQLLFTNLDIDVPPSVPTKVSKTCPLPKDISLLGTSAHIHSHAVDFVATANDTTLYHTTGWSDLTPKVFDPPLELSAGTEVHFTCSYVNETTTTLKFGESAITDEMCILGGVYYPVDDILSPNLLCL